MKLELKDISKHLPYGVKILDSHNGNILDIDIWIATYGTKKIGFSSIFNYAKFKRFKPILRPLSDITKEIVHKGERFVPVEIIWRLAQGYINPFKRAEKGWYDGKFEIKSFTDEWGVNVIQVIPIKAKNQDILEINYIQESTLTFHRSLSPTDTDCVYSVQNQQEIFDFLLSWNFDIDNLIEKGLAIDVNTLNENCYG